jgi:hypothetical protein
VALWKEDPRPITLGEFGTKTTRGLGPLLPELQPFSEGQREVARPCEELGLDASAVWDSLSYLQSLALGLDGALKWSLFEQPWVIDTQANVWVKNDAAGHASHVAGGRWGMRWYDGTRAGQPKPILHITRFLARYLTQLIYIWPYMGISGGIPW